MSLFPTDILDAQTLKKLDCVFGYACFNDASLRDDQRKSAQWTMGKNFDATGGFGPLIVTPDELPLGAEGLRIQCRLNGQVMQDANTRDFLWNACEIEIEGIGILSNTIVQEA
jgi:2-keto-4-pentenoate hydratase/2-oxohepta-3-ene-1,7-dioic acid hydratase in catechol pathway